MKVICAETKHVYRNLDFLEVILSRAPFAPILAQCFESPGKKVDFHIYLDIGGKRGSGAYVYRLEVVAGINVPHVDQAECLKVCSIGQETDIQYEPSIFAF